MTEPLFHGVGVALVTLFDDDLRVDAKATADLGVQLVEAGVTAIVVAGTTGEAASLDLAERAELVRALRDALAPEIPVIAGVGSYSTHQALAYTRGAVDAGADGLLAMSLPGNADLPRYYADLARAAGEVPLLAYNYPAVSAPGIPVSVLRDLPVKGVKDSSGDPDRMLETITTWDQPFYTGSAALLSLAGPIGCAGAILALSNSEPEACIRAFNGDMDAQRSLAVGNAKTKASFPGGIKDQTAARFHTSTARRMG